MATIKLSTIAEAVEKKFSPFEIEVDETTKVTLHPILRLPELTRRSVADLFESTQDPERKTEDGAEFYHEFLALVSKNDRNLPALHDAIAGDLAFYSEILSSYMEAYQAGEASSSES